MRSEQCPYYCEGLCPSGRTVVEPVIVPGSRLMVIGEAPGPTEDSEGVPFCGSSGEELNRIYLRQAGLRRDQVSVTNTVLCLPPLSSRGDYTPSQELVKHCSGRYLEAALAAAAPDVVITAGAVAARRMGLSQPLEEIASLPHWIRLDGRKVLLLPSYHPAAVMRSETRPAVIMTSILRAFEQAGQALRGQLPPEDACLEPDYCEVPDPAGLSLSGGDVSLDTETVHGEWYMTSWCEAPGIARCTRSRNVVSALLDGIRGSGIRLVMHNAPYDMDVLRRAGFRLDGIEIHDTMLAAYEFRTVPQGLKMLARLLAGMEMHSYESTVLPHTLAALAQWVEDAEEALRNRVLALTPVRGESLPLVQNPVPARWLKRKGETVREHRERLIGLRSEIVELARTAPAVPVLDNAGMKMVALLNEVLAAGQRTSHEALSLLDKIRDRVIAEDPAAFELAVRAAELERLPPPPQNTLAHCPDDVRTRYSCRDADATLRIWLVLKRELGVED